MLSANHATVNMPYILQTPLHVIQEIRSMERVSAQCIAACVIVLAKSRRLELGDNILRTL